MANTLDLLNPAAWKDKAAYEQFYRSAAADALELNASGWRPVPDDWRKRIPQVFKPYLWHPFSDPHIALWEWAAGIERPTTPRPFAGFWARGRGKSSTAEMVAVDWGGRGAREYCLYVSETQDQSDKHIATIQRMLERDETAGYPNAVGQPRIGKHGSKTWRRSVMTTASGYTVEAVGLDKAVRGQKIDWARPDAIILDDVDARHDTPHAVQKKIETITGSILPAGSSNCAVLFVQNVIHADSIAHQLSKRPGTTGAADFLANRIISGPFPAVEGLAYEYRPGTEGHRWVITEGRSLWRGFDIAVCEEEINREGPTAFELESQHDVDGDAPDALLSVEQLDATRVFAQPDLARVVVGVDPSGGAGQVGIIAVGTAALGTETHGYTIANASTPKGTESGKWGAAVLRLYYAVGADAIVVETNFGGDMAAENIRAVQLMDDEGTVLVDGRTVPIVEVWASRGKEVRAQPVATLFQLGKAHHVGYFPELQKQWTRWVPGTKPSPDMMDAEVWAYTYLMLGSGAKPQAERPTASKGRVVTSSDLFG